MKTHYEWAIELMREPMAFAKVIQQVQAEQHEATWAMAMEAAAKYHDERAEKLEVDGFGRECYFEVTRHMSEAKRLRAIPCPPLQTTNEKCGG